MQTEEQIRQIVREEIQRNYSSGSPKVAPHKHNNVDNLQIRQSDVLPSTRATGRIQFSEVKRYTLNINSNPNPTLIICYGVVVDDDTSPTIRINTFGTAELGQSYYFQPLTTDSVTPGPMQRFVQASTYLSVQNGGTFHALADEGHLVDVEYPVGTIHARMTLVSFDKSTITLDVTDLDAGWSIIVNLVVI